jgi:hypothetical protein
MLAPKEINGRPDDEQRSPSIPKAEFERLGDADCRPRLSFHATSEPRDLFFGDDEVSLL